MYWIGWTILWIKIFQNIFLENWHQKKRSCKVVIKLNDFLFQCLAHLLMLWSCATEPRFWQRVSERYHNISKSCETKARCDAEAAAKGFKCMRDWYRDWDCVECCQGDRCNYYATVSHVTSNMHITNTRL